MMQLTNISMDLLKFKTIKSNFLKTEPFPNPNFFQLLVGL